MNNKTDKKPPYLIGLLCLIPLVGFFVGIALVLNGIFKYKDKKLVIIGALGVALTLGVYSFLFYDIKYGKGAGEGFAELSQMEINTLVNNIEFYKLKEGQYPDSLKQLLKIDSSVAIKDPLLTRKMNKNINTIFTYRKIGDQYSLYSVGVDGIDGTKDDIYPVISDTGSFKYGFIKKQM